MPARLGPSLGGVLVACAVVALRSQPAAIEPQADTPLVYSAELESIIRVAQSQLDVTVTRYLQE